MQEAQHDAWAQRSVRRGAARRSATDKVASMQQVSFLLLYRIFPSFPHAREKFGMSPGKKTVLREKFGRRCRTAGLERAGMAGRDGGPGPGWGAGRAGMGPGPGWGRGRAGMGAGAGPGWGGVGDVRVPT